MCSSTLCIGSPRRLTRFGLCKYFFLFSTLERGVWYSYRVVIFVLENLITGWGRPTRSLPTCGIKLIAWCQRRIIWGDADGESYFCSCHACLNLFAVPTLKRPFARLWFGGKSGKYRFGFLCL